MDELLNAGAENLDDPLRWPITRMHLVPTDAAGEIESHLFQRLAAKPVILELTTGAEWIRICSMAIPCEHAQALLLSGHRGEQTPSAYDLGRVSVPVGKLCLRAQHPMTDRTHVWWFRGPCDVITPWSK